TVRPSAARVSRPRTRSRTTTSTAPTHSAPGPVWRTARPICSSRGRARTPPSLTTTCCGAHRALTHSSPTVNRSPSWIKEPIAVRPLLGGKPPKPPPPPAQAAAAAAADQLANGRAGRRGRQQTLLAGTADTGAGRQRPSLTLLGGG